MANKNKAKKKEKKKIVKKTNVVLKKKKRKWVSIFAPKNFGGMELGECYLADSQDLKGRRLKVSLSNLGKGKNNSIKIIFEVDGVKEGNGTTTPVGYYLLNSFSRRVVKKGRTKIHKVLKLKTKDGVETIVKVVMSTQNKVQGQVSKSLRVGVDKEISEVFKNNTFEKVLDLIISYQFQKGLKKSLSKIYPVASLEILNFKKV
jgi:small subunit ribosomal protein S3Ae